MAETLLLRKQEAFDAPLPHKDYSMHLLQYAAERSLLPPDMLLALRDGLHTAAAERAAQYTAGKSTTVTRKQAEAFYASVFTQLDAVLLALQSDAAALKTARAKASRSTTCEQLNVNTSPPVATALMAAALSLW